MAERVCPLTPPSASTCSGYGGGPDGLTTFDLDGPPLTRGWWWSASVVVILVLLYPHQTWPGQNSCSISSDWSSTDPGICIVRRVVPTPNAEYLEAREKFELLRDKTDDDHNDS